MTIVLNSALPDAARLAGPEFPPVFTAHAVADDVDPLALAAAGAASGSHGAGDVFWVDSSERVALAFVLEPDVPLSSALQMVPVMMVAVGDALGAIGPPNLGLTFRWPGTILANGATVGRVEARIPAGSSHPEAPAHLVIGLELALAMSARSGVEPGHDPDVTALLEEGCGELDRTDIIEAVARHFLSWIDGWTHEGFRPAHQAWLSRAADMNEAVDVTLGPDIRSGRMIGLDEEGGLLLQAGQDVEIVTLAAVFGAAD